jgi:hypothetical protein
MAGKREQMPVVYSQPPLAQMTQWCIENCIDQNKVMQKKNKKNSTFYLR